MDFACQDRVPQLCREGREALARMRVVIVGVGALGTVAADLLLRSGAECLTLIDDDVVDASNLPRQTLFCEADCGRPKVVAAREQLLRVRSVAILAVQERLSEDNAQSLLDADIVLGCTDDIPSRLLIDRVCEERGIPWVHAAAVGTSGEVFAVPPVGPRYRDLVGERRQEVSCADRGILGVASMMTASLQVSLVLRFVVGKVEPGIVYRLDAWDGRLDSFLVGQ